MNDPQPTPTTPIPPPKTWDDVDLVMIAAIDVVVQMNLLKFPDSGPLRDMTYLLQSLTVAASEIARLTALCHDYGLLTTHPKLS